MPEATSKLCTRPADNRCMQKYIISLWDLNADCFLLINFTAQLGINFDYFISGEVQMCRCVTWASHRGYKRQGAVQVQMFAFGANYVPNRFPTAYWFFRIHINVQYYSFCTFRLNPKCHNNSCFLCNMIQNVSLYLGLKSAGQVQLMICTFLYLFIQKA